jgi:hypothetical protein
MRAVYLWKMLTFSEVGTVKIMIMWVLFENIERQNHRGGGDRSCLTGKEAAFDVF